MSLELAKKHHGEIISLDSRAIYTGMDIGTAKPSEEEQALVPHHMIDIANPDETVTLAEFKQKVLLIIEEIIARGNTPFLVGGTAMYLYAMLENWNIPEVHPDDELRATLDEKDAVELWHMLWEQDPDATKFIDQHNKRRIIRALEVLHATGIPFSKQRTKLPPSFDPLIIGVTQDETTLRNAIAMRTEHMLKAGLIEEVTRLIEKYDQNLPAFSGIHYREVIQYLEEELTEEQMIAEINTHDWQLTRRQLTWFKRDPNIRWVTDPSQAEQLTIDFLK